LARRGRGDRHDAEDEHPQYQQLLLRPPLPEFLQCWKAARISLRAERIKPAPQSRGEGRDTGTAIGV
jgi:hypothetical protein